tara:strand:+ start:22 stop:402 length:381 start_codon:yes stop_codon:yes gene_type:complete
MSWSDCYSASNNIHNNFPPLMSDGRNFSDYQTESNYQQKLQKEGIKSNWEYRTFLVKKANELIKQNQLDACNECGACIQNVNSMPMSVRLEPTDMKQNYVSRINLQQRMVTPVVDQQQLLAYQKSN